MRPSQSFLAALPSQENSKTEIKNKVRDSMILLIYKLYLKKILQKRQRILLKSKV